MIVRHMIVYIRFVLCLSVGLIAAQGTLSADFSTAHLAADGQANMPIVISVDATEATRQVATELADYLGRISGAVFEVKCGDGSAGIVLGTIKEFPTDSLTETLAIHNNYDGREAYAIRTEPARVLLIGATDLGVSHAAFSFLERLGCRWFFPAKEWEVVPVKGTLTASVAETSRPAVLARRIWYAWGFFHDAESKCRSDYEAWARRNRMASSLKIQCHHAWQAIIAANGEVFDAHPEYRALVRGERRGKQLCVSNPKVQEIAVQYAMNYFEQNPDEDMVSMGASDGGGFCECESCVKIGNESNQNFFLVNHVAKAVARKYPGKLVGSYAYNLHCEPPPFKLESNVYIQLTAGFIRGKYTFDELLDLWPKVCPNMGIYDYYDIWPFNRDMLPGSKGGNLSYLRKQIPRFAAAGATSMDCESGNSWGPHGRGYYVANRLMWDPETDVDALLADFYEKAFGPAASTMERYYERLDPGNDPIMGEPLLADALRDLAEATRLARDHPDVQARLDHLKQYLHYVSLRWDLDQVRKDPTKKQQLTLDIFRYAYRTRYSYMIHWEAIRQYWGRQAVKAFKKPTWSPRDGSPKPWEVDQPLTRDETEQFFREDLERFQPQPVEKKTFSSDLVPGGFKRKKGPLPTRFQYQYGARYALYSREGEPLAFTIITGVIASRRNRADAQYTLTDSEGQVVCTGSLAQDGNEHPLKLEVPEAGPYWFEFRDKGAGWKIQAAPNLPCSLALEPNPTYIHMGDVNRLFFYVPKGTTKIHYFTRFGWGKVSDPDEKVVYEVTRNGVNVTVPVPDGADGKVWCLNNVHLPNIWFFNIPNYVASSPEALLVPEEVVVADGLQDFSGKPNPN